MTTARTVLVQRGLWLNGLTIGYNVLEAVASIGAGFTAGSVALISFSIDSAIEVTASAAAQWRLRADTDIVRRERAERTMRRVIGSSLLALAAYVSYESAETLWRRDMPERSVVGLVILALSLVAMPWLAHAKRKVATALHRDAVVADALPTSLCAYWSAIVLVGVALHSLVGGGLIPLPRS